MYCEGRTLYFVSRKRSIIDRSRSPVSSLSKGREELVELLLLLYADLAASNRVTSASEPGNVASSTRDIVDTITGEMIY